MQSQSPSKGRECHPAFLYPPLPSRRTWHSLERGDLMDGRTSNVVGKQCRFHRIWHCLESFILLFLIFRGIFQFALSPGVNQEPPQGGVQIFPCMAHIPVPSFWSSHKPRAFPPLLSIPTHFSSETKVISVPQMKEGPAHSLKSILGARLFLEIRQSPDPWHPQVYPCLGCVGLGGCSSRHCWVSFQHHPRSSQWVPWAHP